MWGVRQQRYQQTPRTEQKNLRMTFPVGNWDSRTIRCTLIKLHSRFQTWPGKRGGGGGKGAEECLCISVNVCVRQWLVESDRIEWRLSSPVSGHVCQGTLHDDDDDDELLGFNFYPVFVCRFQLADHFFYLVQHDPFLFSGWRFPFNYNSSTWADKQTDRITHRRK